MTTAADKLKQARAKLREQRKKLQEAERLADGGYDAHRASMAEASRARSIDGRDIAPLPPVADPERKELCRDDLELFALTYFPARFPLPFAGFHRQAMANLAACTHDGGLNVVALPRGSGKDTLAEVEVLRALLYGHRRFVVLISATEKHAERSLKKIKAELETNDLLAEDFPEACYPIRQLERINNRARGQTLNGSPTRMEWTADTLVLPTVAGSSSSGGVVQVAGLTGAIRGMTVMGPDGQPLRPDMVILNDCQTRESAKSPTQTADREAIISDDVLLLAGPTVTIAATMLCTVIYRGDLSDRYLDPEKHPDWKAVRTRMLESFPTDMEKWDEYAELRRQDMRGGGDGSKATEFYAADLDAMNAGGLASWPDRKKAGELTGLQSAMNAYIDNPRGFFAEMQNDPQAAEPVAGAKELLADSISARLSGTERFQVPADCTRLTAFIDCGLGLHWYAVVAWTERFGGTVVDYGCWPRQARTLFAANDPRPSIGDFLAREAKDDGRPFEMNEAQLVFGGLERLSAEVLGRTYYRVGGGELQVGMCLIDAGWQTKAVYQFVQRYGRHYGCPIHPSKGIGRTATARGVSEWKPRPGERSGYHWRLTSGEEKRTQAVQFDPDAWKTFLHLALTTPPGGPTGLSFYGTTASIHAMIGEHCAAEYSTPVTVRGSTFDKWEVRPDRPDNHLLDTLVGAAVGASLLGVQWSATADGKVEPKPAPAPRKSLADQQREALERFRQKQKAGGR